jgi:hypothetical protein
MAENITGPRVITKRTVETVEGDKRHSIYIKTVNEIKFQNKRNCQLIVCTLGQ